MYNIYFYHFCIIYHTCYLVNLHKENGLFYHKTVHFLSSLVNLFTKSIFDNPIISAVIRIMISYYRKIIAEPFHFSTNLRALCVITLEESVGTKNKNGTPDSTISLCFFHFLVLFHLHTDFFRQHHSLSSLISRYHARLQKHTKV